MVGVRRTYEEWKTPRCIHVSSAIDWSPEIVAHNGVFNVCFPKKYSVTKSYSAANYVVNHFSIN